LSKVVFGVLAHAYRPALEDLLANVRALEPDAPIVAYNGGRDNTLFDGLDIATCPYSKPLHHDWPTPFPHDMMRWLKEDGVDYDYLVILECDMYLLRPGIADHLDRTMSGSDYMAPHFSVHPRLWSPWSIGRRTRWNWNRSGWREMLGTEYPYGCLGAGQVFGRRYAERLLSHPRLPEILQRAQISRLRVLNEIVYPSLAVSMGCNPLRDPNSDALLLRRHSPTELLSHIQNEDCYLVHKIGLDIDSPDRVFLRDFYTGAGHAPPTSAWTEKSLSSSARRLIRRTVRRGRRVVRDVAAIALPEKRLLSHPADLSAPPPPYSPGRQREGGH
jgi:hypothetical protein